MRPTDMALLTVLLPIVGLWLLTTALVTVGVLRLGARLAPTEPSPLPPEAWGAAAASGAAGGGMVGFTLLARAVIGGAEMPLPSLLCATAAGMLLGAVGTTAAVWVVATTWTRGGE